jgi:hypothetical protein
MYEAFSYYSPTSLVYEALNYLAGARAAPLLERFRFSAVGQSIICTFLYFFLTFFLATWQVLAQLLLCSSASVSTRWASQ